MALARMSRLEQKMGSLLNVFPAFKMEEWILPVSVPPTKLDGRWLSLTAAGQRAEMSSPLSKSPLADTVWGSVAFSSFQILARTILWQLPRFQFKDHASSKEQHRATASDELTGSLLASKVWTSISLAR